MVIQPGQNSSLHHWVISPSLHFFFLSSGKFFRPWDPSKHVKFCESQVWPCLFRDHHSVELYLFIYRRVVSFPPFSGPGVGWADDRVGCPELMTSPIFTSSITFVLTWRLQAASEQEWIQLRATASLKRKTAHLAGNALTEGRAAGHTQQRVFWLWEQKGSGGFMRGGARAIVGRPGAQPSTRELSVLPSAWSLLLLADSGPDPQPLPNNQLSLRR